MKAKSLIQSLRSSSAKDRRTLAIELAKGSNEKAMTELERMVEGRHRKDLRWYDYRDQLVGIEALGKTGTLKALEFLSMIYSSVWSYESGESFCTYPMQGSGDMPVYESVKIDSFAFPWARKELGRKLAYSIELNEHRVEEATLPSRSEEEIETELRGMFDREPHSTIQTAIKELEATTGIIAPIITFDWDFDHSNPEKILILLKDIEDKYQTTRYVRRSHSPQAFL